MAMERVFFILIWLSVLQYAGAQQFSIVDEPVCWSIGGVDSSLTRATYVSVTGLHLTTFYINASGAGVDVSAGGNLSFGICNCCADVPPTQDAPYIDTIFTSIQIIPVPPPPDLDSVQAYVYAQIENITDVSQVTACLDAADLPAMCLSSTGNTADAAGRVIFITYTQLTATKAEIEVRFWAYFPGNLSHNPIPYGVVADNGAGSVTIFSGQFY